METLSSIPKSSSFLILSVVVTVLITTPSVTANERNVLLTGDVLGTTERLSYAGFNFIMQDDCNLVLYNGMGGWVSNTHRRGVNCTVTLTDLGQFVIRNGGGSTVWTSRPAVSTTRGKYAAVLRPDGQMAIYGPAVWYTPGLCRLTMAAGAEKLGNLPMVSNLLFSSQILNGNAQLATRDYTFVMRDDCNLVLNKDAWGVMWQSRTQGKGQHCFSRLDHRGQLVVVDDNHTTIWSSETATSQNGVYVLILQDNGQAVVYGPAVWNATRHGTVAEKWYVE